MKSPPQLRMYTSGNLICPRSLHVYRWLWKCHNYLFEVTNKFLRVGKFANIEFPNNGVVLLKAEKAMASHSSTPAWKNPMDGGAWKAAVHGVAEGLTLLSDWLHFHFSLSCIGEGNGNPLQCSCLENPRDGGAWWAAVYGVTQSWTRLKWLSSSSSCWKAFAESRKTPGFLAFRGEEFNLGPVTRLDHSELLCNKVLLKYKRDRESFWHRHQKRAERVPSASL